MRALSVALKLGLSTSLIMGYSGIQPTQLDLPEPEDRPVATSSSSCSQEPGLVDVVHLDRSQLDEAAETVDHLIETTPSISEITGGEDFTILGGSTQHYDDGHQVTTVSTYIASKPATLSILKEDMNEGQTYVSLVKAPDASGGEPIDLLVSSSEAPTNMPAGYYAQGCAAYDGTCLKNAVKNGCNGGACSFLFWNAYAFGSCLLAFCYGAAMNCCTKYVTTWREY